MTGKRKPAAKKPPSQFFTTPSTNSSNQDPNRPVSNQSPSNQRFLIATLVGASVVGLGVVWSLMRDEEMVLDQDPENFYYQAVPENFSPDFNISNTHEDRKRLLDMGGRAVLQSFTSIASNMTTLIVDTLPCMLSFNTLTWLLAKKQNFNINLVPPGFMKEQEGLYINGNVEDHDLSPQMWLPADSDYLGITKSNLPWVLGNEFFHRVTDQSNTEKTNKHSSRSLPFLDANGEVDVELRTKYNDALAKAENRVIRLRMLLEKPFLSRVQGRELARANKILTNYKPYIYRITLSSEREYEDLLKYSKQQNGKTILPPNTPGYQLFADRVVTSTRNNGYNFDVFTTFNGTNAEIFNRDFAYQLSALENNPEYADLDDDHWLAETGSVFNMLSPAQKQFFAPEYCKYMEEYTAMDENSYCAIPQSSRCVI